MSRSRPASNPISYHKHTKQYYVTRGGKRIYLGSDKNEALKKYHQLGLGIEMGHKAPIPEVSITLKSLANRFLVAQQANWRNPVATLTSYKDWLGCFIKDHPRLKATDFTVEKFAIWKLSLKKRNYSPESIILLINSEFGFVRWADSWHPWRSCRDSSRSPAPVPSGWRTVHATSLRELPYP